MSISACPWLSAYVCVCLCVCFRVCVRVGVCVWVYVFVCMCKQKKTCTLKQLWQLQLQSVIDYSVIDLSGHLIIFQRTGYTSFQMIGRGNSSVYRLQLVHDTLFRFEFFTLCKHSGARGTRSQPLTQNQLQRRFGYQKCPLWGFKWLTGSEKGYTRCLILCSRNIR